MFIGVNLSSHNVLRVEQQIYIYDGVTTARNFIIISKTLTE